MDQSDNSPVIFPPLSDSQHTHTVIFLHGRGDTAPNFARTLGYFSRTSANETLQDALPSTIRWVFPRSRMRLSVAQKGAWVSQWFDVRDVRDFKRDEELQLVGLRESVDQIRQLMSEEVARLGGRWDRLVLMGISQGAATAVHTLLNLSLDREVPGDRKLAAFIGFSCRMPFAGRPLDELRRLLGLDETLKDTELLQRTPVLLEHCTDDPLVLVEHGKTLRETLQTFEAQVTWKEYPTGGHWFNSPAGMDDVVQFLKGHVFSESVRDGEILMT